MLGKSYDILIQYNDLYLFFNRDKKTNRELEKKIDREKFLYWYCPIETKGAMKKMPTSH